MPDRLSAIAPCGRSAAISHIERSSRWPSHWTTIFEASTSLVISEQPLLSDGIVEATLQALTAAGGIVVLPEVAPSAITSALDHLPPAFVEDVMVQARAFAALLYVVTVKLRLEIVTTDACKFVHADHATVRLIKAYAGPGTEYAPDHRRRDLLARLPTGATGLLKGHWFGTSHTPCYHRSPRVAGTGLTRLLLVLDEPGGAA